MSFMKLSRICQFTSRIIHPAQSMLAGLVLVAASAPVALSQSPFIHTPFYSTGGTPQSASVVDVNGDGKLDLIALSTSGTVSKLVWLQDNGTGNYGSPATIVSLSAKYTYSFVVGDFNRDGRPDIALSSSAKTLTVYINDGGGHFTAHTYAFSSTVVRAADINHDGNLDLVSNASNGGISVSLGDGTGHFGKEINTKVPGSVDPDTVAAVADYNRDGHLDVIVETDNFQGNYQVLFGKGDGTFRQGPNFVEGLGWVGSIDTVDVNGDGTPDLLVANSNNYTGDFFCGSGTVDVSLGNGDGTFKAPVSYNAGYLPKYITIADLNHDGRPDMIVGNGLSNSVSVLYNLGGGKFSAAHSYTTGTYAPAVYTGDLNRDGKLDMVLLQPGGVSVFLATGSSYRAPQGLEIGDPPQLIASTDFNHDGIYDLAVRTYETYGACRGTGDTATFYLSLGSKGVGFLPVVSKGYFFDSVSSLEAADFNKDGTPDVAFGDGVWLNNGKGQFTQTSDNNNLSGDPESFMAATDFNRDGKADLAFVEGSGAIQIALGKGDGSFTPQGKYTVGYQPDFILQHDLNGDGKKDLVVVNNGSNSISVLLGNGDGTFKPAQSYGVGPKPVAVAVGDFNSDGKTDLAVADGGQVAILLGKGDGTFQAAKYVSVGGTLNSIVVGALTGAASNDIVVADRTNNVVTLLPGNGNGTFAAPQRYYDGSPSGLTLGDFNGDGKLDLAIMNGSSTVMVLYNQQ